ncbi:uncharacterized protein LOC122067711 [Macadamia integrifolia]|uniref:uncharacterized protein LOC122067711 n=1 Tax=Macadamia integrifolia TaxID=60698 RepID=UPI001C4E8972|nr:uncharacterized protein LOC122067711 [Macadamia integrifolia]
MAEVSNIHFPEEDDDGEEVVEEVEIPESSSVHYCFNRNFDLDHGDIFASDSFSPQFSDFIPSDHSFHSHILSDDRDVEEIRDHEPCLYVVDGDDSYSDSVTDVNYFNNDDQVNFGIDLVQRRVEQSHVSDKNDRYTTNPFSENLINESGFGDLEAGDSEMNADYVELGLGWGFTAHGEGEDENESFMITDCGGEFFVSDRRSVSESGESSTVHAAEPFVGGLRVVGIGSDSDEEEGGGLGVDLHSCDDDELDRVPDDMGLPLCWDCLRLDDQREANEDFEWEEVDERIDEREVLSMVIDVDEDRSVLTDIRTGEEESREDREESIRNLEWEVLLAVNNLERNTELEHEIESYHDTESFLAEDYIYTAEYEMLFGQFTGTESALRGSPPAAKSVVENLPSIFLTQDDVKNNNVLCAVCKDDISTEEEAKRLPCSHHYHGDCIIPWLNIRNTCPVCRFELPTDDPDYEQRRTRRAGRRLLVDSQVRSGFEIF